MIVINETLVSTLAAVDETADHFHYYTPVLDTLSLLDLGTLDGDVWEAWAFNGKTFEPSVYSGFAFNSYVTDEGITYGVKEEGIYILDGTSDAGAVIHDGVIFPPSMFGLMNRKRFRNGFFEVSGSAPVIRGEVGRAGVNLPIVNSKAMFPRALVGQKWTFLIADFDELGQVELFPVVLTR